MSKNTKRGFKLTLIALAIASQFSYAGVIPNPAMGSSTTNLRATGFSLSDVGVWTFKSTDFIIRPPSELSDMLGMNFSNSEYVGIGLSIPIYSDGSAGSEYTYIVNTPLISQPNLSIGSGCPTGTYTNCSIK